MNNDNLKVEIIGEIDLAQTSKNFYQMLLEYFLTLQKQSDENI